MLYGSMKLACMQAKINAMKIAKQNRESYLKLNKEIPVSEYDCLPNYDHMSTKTRKRTLRIRRK